MPNTEPGFTTDPQHRIPSCARRIGALLCLGIGIIALGYFLHLQIQARSLKPKIRLREPLPSMIVESSGAEVDLRKFVNGMRSMIVFHSPSCRNCREMMPALQPFPSTLRLVLVNESPDGKNAEAFHFPGAILARDRRHLLSRFIGAASLPVMLFVDETGVLRNGLSGRYSHNFLRKQITNFVSDPDADQD